MLYLHEARNHLTYTRIQTSIRLHRAPSIYAAKFYRALYNHLISIHKPILVQRHSPNWQRVRSQAACATHTNTAIECHQFSVHIMRVWLCMCRKQHTTITTKPRYAFTITT